MQQCTQRATVQRNQELMRNQGIERNLERALPSLSGNW